MRELRSHFGRFCTRDVIRRRLGHSQRNDRSQHLTNHSHSVLLTQSRCRSGLLAFAPVVFVLAKPLNWCDQSERETIPFFFSLTLIYCTNLVTQSQKKGKSTSLLISIYMRVTTDSFFVRMDVIGISQSNPTNLYDVRNVNLRLPTFSDGAKLTEAPRVFLVIGCSWRVFCSTSFHAMENRLEDAISSYVFSAQV